MKNLSLTLEIPERGLQMMFNGSISVNSGNALFHYHMNL